MPTSESHCFTEKMKMGNKVFTQWELQLFQSTVNVKLLSWEKYASSNYRKDREWTASKGQKLLHLFEMLSFLLYKNNHTKPFTHTVSSVKSVKPQCPSSVLFRWLSRPGLVDTKKSGIHLMTHDVPTTEQWTHHLLSSSAVFLLSHI